MHFSEMECEVTLVDPASIAGVLQEKPTALVFPGGRDVPYHEGLQGDLNRKIRDYVQGGGHFIGICAGGYYGTSYTEFDRGGPLEVASSRELRFFPGRAVGPAFPFPRFCYDSEQGARPARLQVGRESMFAYFNGGCYFENAEEYPGVRVIARYAELANRPAAIVQCRCGEGKAALFGVHPEFPLTVLPEGSGMRTEDIVRKRFFMNYLQRFVRDEQCDF
ncbi:MAG: hypothetical protein A3F09_03060 [Chlamydiae bacterium RIFCSPHIGHO2_12_FULL_49_11]|nr:MAG: hypothetical protein A3F09_03060 [Chlamydiae bacterium RIFCSPHIGHO2_12_FULL_49_11]